MEDRCSMTEQRQSKKGVKPLTQAKPKSIHGTFIKNQCSWENCLIEEALFKELRMNWKTDARVLKVLLPMETGKDEVVKGRRNKECDGIKVLELFLNIFKRWELVELYRIGDKDSMGKRDLKRCMDRVIFDEKKLGSS
ncbi:hypothetical protein Tco_0217729 [Tanacetum coccineum]